MGVFGLPITVIIDPEGQEIARLRGDADWSSESAKAIIESLIKRTKPQLYGYQKVKHGVCNYSN